MKIKKEGILLRKTGNGFENEGVLNPACYQEGDKVHMYYRAVREGNYSSLGYCLLDGPLKVEERWDKPVIIPEKNYESQGVEDPRIVKLEEKYYLTYSAYDNTNVFGALAVSSDLKVFYKKGLITPKLTYRQYKHLIECCNCLNEKYLFHYKIFKQHGLGPEVAKKLFVWDKNVIFFPEKIDGKFTFFHRIHPGIQLVQVDNLKQLTPSFWKDYMMNLSDHIVMDPEYSHESSHIGGGCPPVKTDKGWLIIYHAAEDHPHGYIYHAAAALLDLKNPLKVIGRLKKPLISPSYKWEKEGVVNNIIFPSGTAIFDERLYIYYGAADEHVAVASVDINELLEELIKSSI